MFFVTGRGDKFGCVTFLSEIKFFNNMLIDLDGRYLYGLIGRFNIF